MIRTRSPSLSFDIELILPLVAATIFPLIEPFHECDQIFDLFGLGNFSLDDFDGVAEGEFGFENEFTGFVESHAFVGFDADPSESNCIDIVDSLFDPFDDHERGNIAGDSAHSADHGHFSDADKLVDSDHSTDGGFFFDGDVSGDGDVVCDGAVVGDGAVVAHMDKGHDVVAIPDDGFVPGSGSPVNGDKFPNKVIVSDFEECFLSGIFAILGVSAEDGTLVDIVSITEDGVGSDRDVGTEDTSVAQNRFWFNDAKRPDLHILSDVGLGADDCGRVDVLQGLLSS